METQSLTPTTDLSCTFRVQSVRCWLREDTLKSLHSATNLTSFFFLTTASKLILWQQKFLMFWSKDMATHHINKEREVTLSNSVGQTWLWTLWREFLELSVTAYHTPRRLLPYLNEYSSIAHLNIYLEFQYDGQEIKPPVHKTQSNNVEENETTRKSRQIHLCERFTSSQDMERSWNNSHRRIAKPQHSHHMPSLKFELLPFTAVLKKGILENEGRRLPSSRCRNCHSTNPWPATQHLPLVNSMWVSVNAVITGSWYTDTLGHAKCINLYFDFLTMWKRHKNQGKRYIQISNVHNSITLFEH